MPEFLTGRMTPANGVKCPCGSDEVLIETLIVTDNNPEGLHLAAQCVQCGNVVKWKVANRED